MPISNSNWIRHACMFFALGFVGFGINCMLRPASALSFFHVSYPLLPVDRTMIDTILVAYGFRDIYMGMVIAIARYYTSNKALGLVMLASASVAFVDGVACMFWVGKGWWDHWGYAPVIGVIGSILALGY